MVSASGKDEGVGLGARWWFLDETHQCTGRHLMRGDLSRF
jgi:hypothetical protein